ncbi:MAG: hypothetical protein V3U57_01880 [Robiginitomaculum sp.]
MAATKTLVLFATGTLLATISLMATAQAISQSPFANKNKKKAWEIAAPPPPEPHAPYVPAAQTPQIPPAAQNTNGASAYHFTDQPTTVPVQPNGTYTPPANTETTNGQYYPGKQPARQTDYQQTAPRNGTQNITQYTQPSQRQNQAPQNTQGTYQGTYNAAPALRGTSKPSWSERFGIETTFSGYIKAGVAAMDQVDKDVKLAGVADINLRGEVSAITNGGLEYGAGLRARAQFDKHRRGFGGRVGDCPATDPQCASVTIDANARGVKGHTGQFYNDGFRDVRETEFGLEGAYLFLRSSYGDVLIGRDGGSAYLFSLGAPSLLAVKASNSPVDYTGLDSVKTYNDASGFSEKIAYTSPRMLGDNIGVGIQFGASYALNARACGVDYCVRKNTNNPIEALAPEIEDVMEFGVSFDRTFENGLKAELTGTYARGSEVNGNAIFDDLSAYSFGLELSGKNFTFGTSYLNSNNGFAGDGDYTAYDAGITWQPSNWGLTASYGHASDKLARLKSDQAVFGVSYDFDKFRLGTGVQYINRKVPVINGGVREERKEDAAALFIEGSVTF